MLHFHNSLPSSPTRLPLVISLLPERHSVFVAFSIAPLRLKYLSASLYVTVIGNLFYKMKIKIRFLLCVLAVPSQHALCFVWTYFTQPGPHRIFRSLQSKPSDAPSVPTKFGWCLGAPTPCSSTISDSAHNYQYSIRQTKPVDKFGRYNQGPTQFFVAYERAFFALPCLQI